MAPLTSEQLRLEHRNPTAVASLTLTLRALTDVSCLLGFAALERLDLSCNNIRTLEGLGGFCGNLKWLSVAQNKIESLKGVEGLSRLTVLNAGQNMIQSMDEVMSLANLRALILNDNKISSIANLDLLKNINTLVLSRNPIRDIGKSLVNVKSLTKISFSNCEIEEIGSSLSFCVELKEARFAHNHITTIPQHIMQNSKLQLLDVGNNAISRWSDIKVLSELHNLKNLNLHGNPIAEKDKILKKVRKLVPKLQVFNAKPIEKFCSSKKVSAEGILTSNKDRDSFQVSPIVAEEKRRKGRTDPEDKNVLPTGDKKRQKIRFDEQEIPSEAIRNKNACSDQGESKSSEGENDKRQKKSKVSKSRDSKIDTSAKGKDQPNADLRGREDEAKVVELGARALEFDDCETSFMDIVFSGREEESRELAHDNFLGGLVIDPSKDRKKKKKKITNAITGRSALSHLPPAADVGTGGASAWDD